jgi:hypothetical protein
MLTFSCSPIQTDADKKKVTDSAIDNFTAIVSLVVPCTKISVYQKSLPEKPGLYTFYDL